MPNYIQSYFVVCIIEMEKIKMETYLKSYRNARNSGNGANKLNKVSKTCSRFMIHIHWVYAHWVYAHWVYVHWVYVHWVYLNVLYSSCQVYTRSNIVCLVWHGTPYPQNCFPTSKFTSHMLNTTLPPGPVPGGGGC